MKNLKHKQYVQMEKFKNTLNLPSFKFFTLFKCTTPLKTSLNFFTNDHDEYRQGDQLI